MFPLVAPCQANFTVGLLFSPIYTLPGTEFNVTIEGAPGAP